MTSLVNTGSSIGALWGLGPGFWCVEMFLHTDFLDYCDEVGWDTGLDNATLRPNILAGRQRPNGCGIPLDFGATRPEGIPGTSMAGNSQGEGGQS